MQKPQSGTSSILQSPNEDLKDMNNLCIFKIKIESQNSDHECNKASECIQIKINLLNSSQEPPASSEAPNQDLKDMDVLFTFKIKTESQNLDHGCIKDQWPYPNKGQDAKSQSGTYSVL